MTRETDELRCPVCYATATENAKGRLEMTHDWSLHRVTVVETPVTPLRRPSRTGAWGDDDE